MQDEAVIPLLNGRSTWRLIAKNKIHQLTHRRLHADAYLLRGEIPCIPNFVRVVRSDCSAYAFPKLVNILFERFWEYLRIVWSWSGRIWDLRSRRRVIFMGWIVFSACAGSLVQKP